MEVLHRYKSCPPVPGRGRGIVWLVKVLRFRRQKIGHLLSAKFGATIRPVLASPYVLTLPNAK